MIRRLFAPFVGAFLFASSALAQLYVPPTPVDTSQFTKQSDLSGYAKQSDLAPLQTAPQVQSAISANTPGFITATTGGPIASMGGGRAPSVVYVLTNNVSNSTTSDVGCFGSGVGSATIAANAPYAGNSFRLLCRGVYTTGTLNVSGVTVKLKLGSVTLASVTTPGFPASLSNYPFVVDATCTVRDVTTRSTSTIMCNGQITFWTVINTVSLASPPSLPLSSGSTPVVFDSSIANMFQVTSALTSLTGSPSVMSTTGSIEILY